MIINRVNPAVSRHGDQHNGNDINYRVGTKRQKGLKVHVKKEYSFFFSPPHHLQRY